MNLTAWARRALRIRSYYRGTFETIAGQKTLADLRRFCRHGDSPLVTSAVRQQVDPIATAVRIGRQEVFQRILQHIHIDDAQLMRLRDETFED